MCCAKEIDIAVAQCKITCTLSNWSSSISSHLCGSLVIMHSTFTHLFYFLELAISSFMSASICNGEVIGMNRFTGTPFLSQRNLQKFHFNPWPKIPLGILALKNVNTGTVCRPFSQSTFPKIGNLAPFDVANSTISAFVPGSCEPKLLQGNASISKSSPYFS